MDRWRAQTEFARLQAACALIWLIRRSQFDLDRRVLAHPGLVEVDGPRTLMPLRGSAICNTTGCAVRLDKGIDYGL